jgi:hypothetical protein
LIPGWLEVVRTAVFWAVTLAMVGYVVWSYLRDHPEILEAMRRLRIVAVLRALLGQLRRRVSSAAEALGRLTSTQAADRPARDRPLRATRLRALSPRERVLHYYMNMLQRAARMGIPRRRDHTPHEYDAVLGPRLTEGRPALLSLTEAFLVARYSPHEVGRDDEKQAREEWREISKALSALRREIESAEKKE